MFGEQGGYSASVGPEVAGFLAYCTVDAPLHQPLYDRL